MLDATGGLSAGYFEIPENATVSPPGGFIDGPQEVSLIINRGVGKARVFLTLEKTGSRTVPFVNSSECEEAW